MFVGGINTIFGLSLYPVFFLLLKKYNVHYLATLIISWIMATAFSFITNRNIVFKSTGQILCEYVKFIQFHAVVLVINLIFLPYCVEMLKIQPVYAQLFFGFVVVVSSYFWYKKVTFRRSQSKMQSFKAIKIIEFLKK